MTDLAGPARRHLRRLRREDRVRYWRRQTVRTKRGPVPAFGPWPPKAQGPKPRGDQRLVGCGLVRVVEMIAADPIAAQKVFSRLTVSCCCCCCGKTLTDDHSKSYGIGPEFRKGIPAEVLARYLTPQVQQAHAERLAEQGALFT